MAQHPRWLSAAAIAAFLPTALVAADGTGSPTPDHASPFAQSAPVAGEDLAKISGQGNLAMDVRANNTATVSHNSVSGQSETGTINFSATSFQNMSGLSLLSANTGNNVAINSSLNVNVAIRP